MPFQELRVKQLKLHNSCLCGEKNRALELYGLQLVNSPRRHKENDKVKRLIEVHKKILGHFVPFQELQQNNLNHIIRAFVVKEIKRKNCIVYSHLVHREGTMKIIKSRG